jgi:hypothetical protein
MQSIFNFDGENFIVNVHPDGYIDIRLSTGQTAGFEAALWRAARAKYGVAPLVSETDRLIEMVGCYDCTGTGKTSAHLGVIDPSDWDDEELAFYMSGGYDKPCASCHGTGRQTVHLEHFDAEDDGNDSKETCMCFDCRADEAAFEREWAAERRMGA